MADEGIHHLCGDSEHLSDVRRLRALPVGLAPQQVQDKVGFIVNNLSAANLDAKARELRGVVTPDMWPWFANYMVVKRAAQEPNFHSLYLQVRRAAGML